MKKTFPLSFKYAKNLITMLIGIIIYLVIGAIAFALIGLAGSIGGWIPVIGEILGLVLKIVSAIVELYVLIGLILLILAFFRIIK